MNAHANIEQTVPIYDIAPRSRLIVDGIEYEYKERLDEGHTAARADDLKFVETFTHDKLHELILNNEIQIDEGYYTTAKADLRLRRGQKTFNDLSETKQLKVLFKEDWCKRFIRLEHSDRTIRRSDRKMEIAVERISKEIKADTRTPRQRGGAARKGGFDDPGPVQLRRWVKLYEKADFNRDALIDRYNGPGTIRVTLEADSYAVHHEYATMYASNNRPKKAELFLKLQAALDDADGKRLLEGKPPLRRLKRRAFEKMIDRLDPFFVCIGRDGPDAALRKWGILTTGLDVEKPFERLEMDEWKVSLMTLMVDAGVWEMLDEKQKAAVKRKRVWLSVAIDARTRMIVAMRFLDGAPCIESALGTIELAMRDKSRIAEHVGASPTYLHAKPRSIAMDNGSNYTANDVMARVVRLGISAHYPPAGLAEMRARIERLFGTLKTKIISLFTGQTFSNILEKGDYDSSANASLNVEELNRCFLRGVLDLYHHHPHEGLLGETPYQCMLRLSNEYGLPLPPNRDVLRHVMGVSSQRRIGDAGVRFLGIRYQSKALQIFRREARQKPIEIRVDRFDLSSISVKTSRGWIVCNARYKGLEGVSLWQWAEAIRDLRGRNVDLAAASRHLVIDAVRNLSSVAAEAVKRAEIKNPVVTTGTFQTLEATLFRGLTFADDGEWGDDFVSSSGTLPVTDLTTTAQSHGPISSDAEKAQASEDDLYLTDHGFGSESEWTSN